MFCCASRSRCAKPTMIYNSETAERRVDVAEFVDWAIACGKDPIQALKDFLRQRKSCNTFTRSFQSTRLRVRFTTDAGAGNHRAHHAFAGAISVHFSLSRP